MIVLSYSICWYCPDTGRSTGSYIVFYQGGPIDNCTHVISPVDQYSSESEYNEELTSRMDMSHFRMLNNELLINNPYVVP